MDKVIETADDAVAGSRLSCVRHEELNEEPATRPDLPKSIDHSCVRLAPAPPSIVRSLIVLAAGAVADVKLRGWKVLHARGSREEKLR